MKNIVALLATIMLCAAPQVVARSRHDARVELGRRLFYDADLSRDGTMSCATCHEQRHGFADGNRVHPGVTDEPGRRNVPGLANVGHFSPLTWADPRQTTLERQAAVPVFGTHPVEMGMAGMQAEIPRRLGRDPCYRQMFAAAFPGRDQRPDFAKVARALASFERSLISRDAPFDRNQLSPEAIAGWSVFRRSCASCHKGPDFTDMAFHRLGRADPAAPDQGLYEATGKQADRGRIRTPSLRNVAVTAPYWHDGSALTLDDAIARHGLALAPARSRALAAFLGALTDDRFLNNPAFSLPQTACGMKL
ncbi:cytochrome-c peroxidase [Novosphingobium humi]|uniref:Cytochrome c peroxidase n=1 Tax=Novosphingobium humi TaxID=2282397 RepID=A0ABY7U1V6_9SPHN|nr:cytochrome c peroxidase [Novosphingobium humi]WCT78852.1 cytochrome c peroxidase [Novosphingobium humi]